MLSVKLSLNGWSLDQNSQTGRYVHRDGRIAQPVQVKDALTGSRKIVGYELFKAQTNGGKAIGFMKELPA
jgi:hypothetical protein